MENLNTSNEQPNNTQWDDLAEKSTDDPEVVENSETTDVETPAEPTAAIDEEMAALDAMEEMEALESAEARQAAEIADAESVESTEPTEAAEPIVEESVEVDDFSPVSEEEPSGTDDQIDDSRSIIDHEASLEEESYQRFEREATGQDYAHFAKEEFDHLMNKIKHPQDGEDTSNTEASLAVIMSILSTASEFTPTKPDELFNNIRKACTEASATAREKGNTTKADAYERQANVSDLIEQRCHLYLTETYAAYANQANAEHAARIIGTNRDDSLKTPANAEENPLTGDAIS